jgi:hypothetical protein
VFNALNVSASDLKPKTGYGTVPHGSSYVQVVQFDDADCRVEPRTILTYSQSTNRESPFFSDQTRMYGRKQWVDMPFCEDEVARATLSSLRLSSRGRGAAQRCPDRFAVRARSRGRRVAFSAPRGTRIEVFRMTSRGARRVVRRARSSYRPRAGTYFARFRRGTQSRRIAFTMRGRRARMLAPFERVVPCGPLRRLKLTGPTFGGRRSLGVAFRLGERARVSLRILRGRRVVRRITGTRRARVEHKLRLPARSRRGTYRIVLTATGPSGTVRETVTARRR